MKWFISVCSENVGVKKMQCPSSLWKPNFCSKNLIFTLTLAPSIKYKTITVKHDPLGSINSPLSRWRSWKNQLQIPEETPTSPRLSALPQHSPCTKGWRNLLLFQAPNFQCAPFACEAEVPPTRGGSWKKFSAHIFWSQEFRIFRTPPPQCTDGIKKLFFKMTESLHRST